MITCPKCGTNLPPDAAFCGRCGQRLSLAETAAAHVDTAEMPYQQEEFALRNSTASIEAAPRVIQPQVVAGPVLMASMASDMNTKFCKECGARILRRAKICPQCGCQVEDFDEMASVAAKNTPQVVINNANNNNVSNDTEVETSIKTEAKTVATAAQIQPQMAPVGRLNISRDLIKYIVLNIITLGIYGLIAMADIADSVNIAASQYDSKRTMNFWLLTLIVAPLTLGIGFLIWYHNISERIGNELIRRGIHYSFGAGSFWGWCILGSLIGIGPFVYLYKLFKATNLMCEDYNRNG